MNALVLKKPVLLALLAAGVLTGCAGTQTVEGEYNPNPTRTPTGPFTGLTTRWIGM